MMKGKLMKRTRLLIAILPLAFVTLTAAGMNGLLGGAAAAVEPALTAQKPKGDELKDQFSQTYQLTFTGGVRISNINGDVHVNVWDQSTVKVDAVKRAYSQERLSEITIDVNAKGDTLHISTKYPDRQNYGGRNRGDSAGSVEYTLTIPRGASLQSELVNGDLDVAGVQGDVNASLVNGTIKAVGLGGEVKLSTVNGNLQADWAGLSGSKSVNLSSVNGSIVLFVPAAANADVKASTVHGKILNDFGLAVDDGQHVGQNLSGQIGSGGTRVRLNSVNGSIAIKRGGGAM